MHAIGWRPGIFRLCTVATKRSLHVTTCERRLSWHGETCQTGCALHTCLVLLFCSSFVQLPSNQIKLCWWCAWSRLDWYYATWDVDRKSKWLAVVLRVLLLPSTQDHNLMQQAKRFMDRNSENQYSNSKLHWDKTKQIKKSKTTPPKDNT